jgi:peptidyl-prolyl cis-trans isomerase D
MGPLLVIFVGLALFAFIAGDAVKLFDSHSVDTSVGTVGEMELDAMDYQEIYNEFDGFCRVSGFDVPEESRKAVIWELLSNSALYNQYAEELGITVTAEEMNHVLANGKSLFVMQTASAQNPLNSNGRFNLDFLAQLTQVYDEQKAAGMVDQNVAIFYNCWKYMEKEIMLEILRNKINALVANGTIANPAVAQKNFDLNNNTYTLDVALYPYSKMVGDSIAVSDEEITRYHKENKEFGPIFKNAEESRLLHGRTQHILKPERYIRILGGIVKNRLWRKLTHVLLEFATFLHTNQVLNRYWHVVKPLARHRIHAVTGGGVEDVMLQHCVMHC